MCYDLDEMYNNMTFASDLDFSNILMHQFYLVNGFVYISEFALQPRLMNPYENLDLNKILIVVVHTYDTCLKGSLRP